jgi:hypothetical protein
VLDGVIPVAVAIPGVGVVSKVPSLGGIPEPSAAPTPTGAEIAGVGVVPVPVAVSDVTGAAVDDDGVTPAPVETPCERVVRALGETPAPVATPCVGVIATVTPGAVPALTATPTVGVAVTVFPGVVPDPMATPCDAVRRAAKGVPEPVATPGVGVIVIVAVGVIPAPVATFGVGVSDAPPAAATTRSRSNQPADSRSASTSAMRSASNKPADIYASRLIVPKDPTSTVVFVAVSDRHLGINVPAFAPFSTKQDKRAP